MTPFYGEMPRKLTNKVKNWTTYKKNFNSNNQEREISIAVGSFNELASSAAIISSNRTISRELTVLINEKKYFRRRRQWHAALIHNLVTGIFITFLNYDNQEKVFYGFFSSEKWLL